MAIGLGTILGLAPLALRGISAGLKYLGVNRDQGRVRKKDIIKQSAVTPEQAAIKQQSLQQGVKALRTPQQVFLPGQPQMQEAGDITAGLPQQIGQASGVQRPGGLMGILNAIQSAAQSGYQEDLARIGARRGPVRNPLGRTSGYSGMASQALRSRASGLLRDRYKLISDYANRATNAELEAGALGVQREGAQNQLQNFLNQLRQQQVAGEQEEFLGQRQLEIDEATLRNILEAERYRQGIRKYRLGQQSQFMTQQSPSPRGV